MCLFHRSISVFQWFFGYFCYRTYMLPIFVLSRFLLTVPYSPFLPLVYIRSCWSRVTFHQTFYYISSDYVPFTLRLTSNFTLVTVTKVLPSHHLSIVDFSLRINYHGFNLVFDSTPGAVHFYWCIGLWLSRVPSLGILAASYFVMLFLFLELDYYFVGSFSNIFLYLLFNWNSYF